MCSSRFAYTFDVTKALQKMQPHIFNVLTVVQPHYFLRPPFTIIFLLVQCEVLNFFIHSPFNALWLIMSRFSFIYHPTNQRYQKKDILLVHYIDLNFFETIVIHTIFDYCILWSHDYHFTIIYFKFQNVCCKLFQSSKYPRF